MFAVFNHFPLCDMTCRSVLVCGVLWAVLHYSEFSECLWMCDCFLDFSSLILRAPMQSFWNPAKTDFLSISLFLFTAKSWSKVYTTTSLSLLSVSLSFSPPSPPPVSPWYTFPHSPVRVVSCASDLCFTLVCRWLVLFVCLRVVFVC